MVVRVSADPVFLVIPSHDPKAIISGHCRGCVVHFMGFFDWDMPLSGFLICLKGGYMKELVQGAAAVCGILGFILLLFAPHIGVPLATIGVGLAFSSNGMK